MTQLPPDPRDKRIEDLEKTVQELQLLYAMQFGNDKVAGAMVGLLTTMSSDLKDVKTALFGEARDGSGGLLVRIDRLEQWAKTARWVIATIVAAGIGEVIWFIINHRVA